MRHSVALALVLLAAVVCNADVPVAPRETGPSTAWNGSPLVVADGGELVAIWSSPGQSHFARVRPSGEVLLTGDFAPPGEVVAAVAGPHGSVLAALSDAEGIRVATIARNGEVRISERVGPSLSSMAWNGSALLIVFRTGGTIVTDENGRLLNRGDHLQLPEEGFSSAAARGSGFVVAWAGQNDVIVTTLTSSGSISKKDVIADRMIGRVGIGCDGSGTCLLLSSMREPLSGQILGASPQARFRISDDLVADAIPPIWDGRRFLVVWTDYSFGERSMHAVIQVAAVALDGTVTRLATIASPDRNRETPAIAQANGAPVVVWQESSHCGFSGTQVVVRSLATDRELRLTHGLSSQSEPALAAGATNTLVAWVERSGGARIRARLFPFTEPAFDVSPGPASGAPVVASDGSGYLLAWRESLPEDDCRSALQISLAGSGTTRTLGHDVDSVQVTWNGSEYVILWEQADPAQLLAMRIDRSGQPLDPAPVALTSAEAEPDSYTSIDHDPAGLFRTGNGYLLLWKRSRVTYIPLYPDPPPQFDVRITAVGPQLFPSAGPQVVASAYNAVATMKGGNVVALWMIGRTLHAVRLSPTGAILADRDLGLEVTPARVIATRAGYAVLAYGEILFLDDDLSLTGRRATASAQTTIAETSTGLLEAYEADGTVFLSPPPPRRRRSVR